MFPFDAAAGLSSLGAGQPVTSGGAGEQDADAPDDGTKLVYRTPAGHQAAGLERTIADGRDRLLVEADSWDRTRPRWSSDGRWVSYLRRRSCPCLVRSGEGAVTILSVDRREEVLLTRPGKQPAVLTDWSRDGRWLLGSCPQPGTRTVCIRFPIQVTQDKPSRGTGPGAHQPIRRKTCSSIDTRRISAGLVSSR